MSSTVDRSRALACNEFVELVTDYIEGTLPTRARRRVDKHLAGCDGCNVYLQQMRVVPHAAGSIDLEPMHEDLLERLIAAFRATRNR